MPYTPPYRRKSDKSDKPKHDRFEKITLGVAIVAVVVLAVTAGIMAWQTILTNRAVEDAHAQINILAAQQRPWVVVDTIQTQPVFDGLAFNKDGSASIAVNIVTKNVGAGVAIGAFAAIKVVVESNNPMTVMQTENGFCDYVRGQAWRDPHYLGETVPPGTGPTFLELANINKQSIQNGIIHLGGKPILILLVVGCIDYQFYGLPQRHQTRFVYELMGGKDEQFIVPGKNLPASEVSYRLYTGGNGYAD